MTTRRTFRSFRRRWRTAAPWVKINLVAFAVALCHMMLYQSSFGQRLEPHVLDLWFSLRGAVTAPQDVVIVSIDEESHRQLGISTLKPWPRELQTKLLRKLAAAGPKAVVFDFVFSQRGDHPAVDQELAEAMRSLPTFIGSFNKSGKELFRAQAGRSVDGQAHQLKPLDLFAGAAQVFPISLPIDHGIVRRFYIDPATRAPAFSRLLPPDDKRTAPAARDFLNYYGPAGSISTVSAYVALSEEPSAAKQHFHGKIVFVGELLALSRGIQSKDSFITPYSRIPTAGVEIHATAAANLQQGVWIKRFRMDYENLVLAAAAFLMTLLITRFKPGKGLVIVLASAVLWAALSYAAFFHHRFIPGLILVVIVLPALFTVSSFHYYLRLLRTYRDIESALGIKLYIRE